jgi:hypothetical protein
VKWVAEHQSYLFAAIFHDDLIPFESVVWIFCLQFEFFSSFEGYVFFSSTTFAMLNSPAVLCVVS